MLEKDTKDLNKEIQASIAIADALRHALEQKERDFAQTPEGREVAYLKKVAEYYFSSLDNFLKRFISTETSHEPGMRLVLKNLEHPDAGFSPDEKIIKKLGRFARGVEKDGAANDPAVFTACKEGIKMLDALQVSGDIAGFNTEINRIYAWLEARLKGTDLWKKVGKRENVPHFYAAATYEHTILALKFMLSRLYRPEQKSKAMAVIREVPRIDGIAERISATTKDSGARSEIESCFATRGEEDSNLSNLMSFTDDLAKRGGKNVFIRYLRMVGQEKIADLILRICVKNGRSVQDPKIITLLASAITHLSADSIKAQYENAAKNELKALLEKQVQYMEKTWKSEFEEVKHLFEKRVEEIIRGHAKALADLKKDIEKLDSANEKTYEEAGVISDLDLEYNKAAKFAEECLTRIADLGSIISAIIELERFERGNQSLESFEVEIAKLKSPESSRFLLSNLDELVEVAKASAEGRLDVVKLADHLRFLKTEKLPLLQKQKREYYKRVGETLSFMAIEARGLSLSGDRLVALSDEAEKEAHNQEKHWRELNVDVKAPED